jgi:hypothetical protein
MSKYIKTPPAEPESKLVEKKSITKKTSKKKNKEK